MEEVEPKSTAQTLFEHSRAYVLTVLAACGGNKSQAARMLGIDRRSLYRWLASDAHNSNFQTGKRAARRGGRGA